jgi:hypothetical protein
MQDELRKIRSKLLGVTGRINSTHITGITGYIGMNRCQDPKVEHISGLVGAAIRLHGPDFITHDGHTTTRLKVARHYIAQTVSSTQHPEFTSEWEKLQQTFSTATRAHIAKKTALLIKSVAHDLLEGSAQTYLKHRSSIRKHFPTDGTEWDLIAQIPRPCANTQTRYAALNFLAGMEPLCQKYRKFISKHPECVVCGEINHAQFITHSDNNPRYVCTSHATNPRAWATAYSNNGTTTYMALAAAGLLLLPPGECHPDLHKHWKSPETCSLCGCGPPTVEHLMHNCLVTQCTLNTLFQCDTLLPKAMHFQHPNCGSIQIIHLIHQLRLKWHSTGKSTTTPLTPNKVIENVRHILVNYAMALPPTARPRIFPPIIAHLLSQGPRGGRTHTTTTKANEELERACQICHEQILPGCMRTPRVFREASNYPILDPRQTTLCTGTRFSKGGYIAIVHLPSNNDPWGGSNHRGHFYPAPKIVYPPETPNATFTYYTCTCGKEIGRLCANQAINRGTLITIYADSKMGNKQPQLLMQADGGTKNAATENHASGGGVAVWHFSFIRAPSLLMTLAIPLPFCENAMQAEGATSAWLISLIPTIIAYCRNRELMIRNQIIIQLDNRTMATFWNGQTKIKNYPLRKCVRNAEPAVIQHGRKLVFQHIHREINIWADAGATAARIHVEAGIKQGTARNTLGTWFHHDCTDIGDHKDPKEIAPAFPRNLPQAILFLPPPPIGPEHQKAIISLGEYYGLPIQQIIYLRYETPIIEASALPLIARTTGDRKHAYNAFLQILAVRTHHRLPGIWVAHTTKGNRNQGRAELLSPGGSGMSRKTRLLCYGRTHDEYDIRMCHWSLLVEHINEDITIDYPWLLKTDTAIDEISKLVGLAPDTGVPKQLTRLLIYGSEDNILTYISDKGGQVGPQLTTFLEKFTAQKKIVLKSLLEKGFRGREQTTEKNELYFALESLEATIIRQWASNITRKFPHTSIIEHGDALWVSNDIHAQEVDAAFHASCMMVNLHTLRLRVVSLHKELIDVIGNITLPHQTKNTRTAKKILANQLNEVREENVTIAQALLRNKRRRL